MYLFLIDNSILLDEGSDSNILKCNNELHGLFAIKIGKKSDNFTKKNILNTIQLISFSQLLLNKQ